MIKNPNKTAVKLFLVPYDLSDMTPGTKTFIRQRSYSAGPVIDMPLSKRTNLGTDRPEASLSTNIGDDPNDRPVLRYLIHLNICCLGEGGEKGRGRERYYLYGGLRVVFANRVPDGKERLRNEIQMQEPRYAPYRPGKENATGVKRDVAGTPMLDGKESLSTDVQMQEPSFALTRPGMENMAGVKRDAAVNLR